jgi:CBS domain containing-hemolysin-like protein
MTAIWYPLALAAIGLFLSAFFSGSETGFYRATRLRLMLDALGGDWIGRGLLWLTNRPSLFVATTLVGNNLANYVTSLAIVMGTQILAGNVPTAELIAPLVLAPVLFIYGELLPKDLFLQAPNRLLRLGGPLFLVCLVLFFPVSLVLWGLNKVLQRLVGQAPEQIRVTLARRELRRFLEEGHEAGILRPSQRELAQGIFAVANLPVSEFATPLEHLPRARSDMTKQDVLRLARSYRLATVPVESADSPAELIGCLRVIELGLSNVDAVAPIRNLLEISAETPQIEALMQMQSEDADLARVTNQQGETVGVITAARLREPLFRGER